MDSMPKQAMGSIFFGYRMFYVFLHTHGVGMY